MTRNRGPIRGKSKKPKGGTEGRLRLPASVCLIETPGKRTSFNLTPPKNAPPLKGAQQNRYTMLYHVVTGLTLWKQMVSHRGPLALRPTLTDGLPFSPDV